MKVFITGGSGFVGRNIIVDLLQHDDTVVALSRSEASDHAIRNAAATAGGNANLFRGDVNVDTQTLAQGMTGCDAVIHCAAKVGMWGEWDGFKTVTVDGTKNVLAAARQAKVGRLVHIGTEAVLMHGAAPIANADETAPTPLPPFYAPYTESKILSERAVLAANDPDGGFATVVVRPRFIWGRGDTVVLVMLTNAVDKGQWRFFSPRYKSSTCHVRNVAEGTRLAALKGKPGEVYFLTDGAPVVFEDFVTQVLETQGRADPAKGKGRIPFRFAWALATILEALPFFGFGIRREAPVGRQMLGLMAHEVTVVDAKARRELGYTSSVSMQQGMQELREDPAAQSSAVGKP